MKEAVNIVLENEKGEILLQLRDNKPGINHPGQWSLFGGFMEKNESKEEAIRREVKEEIELSIDKLKYFNEYNYKVSFNHTFVGKVGNINPKEINLKEGQETKFFKENEIKSLEMPQVVKKTVLDYFNSRNKTN